MQKYGEVLQNLVACNEPVQDSEIFVTNIICETFSVFVFFPSIFLTVVTNLRLSQNLDE